jgi:hypothetical protein
LNALSKALISKSLAAIIILAAGSYMVAANNILVAMSDEGHLNPN